MFKLRQYNLRDDVTMSFRLFNALIAPILRYACEVCAPFEVKKLQLSNLLSVCESCDIEKLNNKFCKYMLGVHKYSTNLVIKAELGSHGLLIDCLLHSMKYWLRFVNKKVDVNSLVYKSYVENLQIIKSRSDCENWCFYVKKILTTFNFDDV